MRVDAARDIVKTGCGSRGTVAGSPGGVPHLGTSMWQVCDDDDR